METETPTTGAGDAVKAAALLAALAALVALNIYGGKAAASVLVGAAAGITNLRILQAVVRKLVQGTASGRGAPGWAVLAALKIVFLLAGLAFLLTRHYVDPMPLAVGYMAMPLGIVVGAVWSSLRPRH